MDGSSGDFFIDPESLKWEPPPSLLQEDAFSVDLTPKEQEDILKQNLGTTLTMKDIEEAENSEWTSDGITDVDLNKRIPDVTTSKPVTREALLSMLQKSDAEFTAAVTSGVEGAAAAYADQKFKGLMTQVYARLLDRELSIKDIPQAVRDVFTGAALSDVVSVSLKDAIKDISLGTLDNATDLHDKINAFLVASYPQFEQASERFSIIARNVTLRIMKIKGRIEKGVFKVMRKWIILDIKILAFVAHIVLWILKWAMKVAAIALGKGIGWALKPAIPTIAAALSPLLLLSSSSMKTDINPLTEEDVSDIRRRIDGLKLCSWKYSGDQRKHVGPMAESFAEAFDGVVDPVVDGTVHLGDVAFLLMAEVQRLSRENACLFERVVALEQAKK